MGSVAVHREIVVAEGVFAPGHLGQLTRIVPFERSTRRSPSAGPCKQRPRKLPAGVTVYQLLAAALFARRSRAVSSCRRASSTPAAGRLPPTCAGTREATAIVTATHSSRSDRSKTCPTQRRSTRPAPRRRRAPSPDAPSGRRASVRRDTHQRTGPGTPTTSRHRPRGAALGAGFHLHAHASFPRWEHILDRETHSDSGSPS
ncbi:transposase domain-containing protein [Streptomyces sp. NPDC006539]|uniref:transposase domain-containing protein n=1 Tax=Streptomyces sp. NPDC006539 TaxID=3155352 RepID=UPI0033BEC4E2